jgi:hypothetical protein
MLLIVNVLKRTSLTPIKKLGSSAFLAVSPPLGGLTAKRKTRRKISGFTSFGVWGVTLSQIFRLKKVYHNLLI